MKKIVLVLTILLSINAMNGQGLEIGVYAEPQFVWLTSDNASATGNGSVLNFNTGIEFDVFFMPNYAFSIGLTMNNQGGKFISQDTIVYQLPDDIYILPPATEVKHSFQYVGIPIGLKLKTEEMGYTTIYFHGGLAPMLNMRAATSSEQENLVKENIENDVNFLSLNYFLETGFEYRLAGNTAIIVGFKWSAGFNDVTTNDISNINLSSAGLHLGLLF
ncbi:porin family protein [Bacteroidota bacterium]